MRSHNEFVDSRFGNISAKLEHNCIIDDDPPMHQRGKFVPGYFAYPFKGGASSFAGFVEGASEKVDAATWSLGLWMHWK
jgi:hypothetical protein